MSRLFRQTLLVVTAGVYAFTVNIKGLSVPDGDVFDGRMRLDADNKDAVARFAGRGGVSGEDVGASASCTISMPGGGQIKIPVANLSDDTFDIKMDELVIQRIS